MDGEQLKRNILKDMRTELADEFDKNFDRKAFSRKMETSRKSGRQRLAADGDWDNAAQCKGRGKSKRRAFFICRTLRGYPQRRRHGNKTCAPAYPHQPQGQAVHCSCALA